MEKVEEEFKQIKEDMYNDMQKPVDDNILLKNMNKLKNVDDEFRELIVLLYSNYKTELHLLHSNQYVQVTKLVDANMKLLNRIKTILHVNMGGGIPETNKAPTGNRTVFSKFIEMPNAMKIVILLFTGGISLILLHEAFPASTEMVLGALKEIFQSKTTIVTQ